jgi:hypothetical protein
VAPEHAPVAPASTAPARVRIAAALLLVSASAGAGERLSVERLLELSDATVTVRVDLGSTGTRVVVGEVIRGSLPPDASLAGLATPCVPDRATLRRWIGMPNYFEESVPLWRAALQRGHYEAVIFVRTEAGSVRAVCETETLLAEHWVTHPDHAGWLVRLREAAATADRR